MLVIHRQAGGDFKPDERERVAKFAARGGSIVVIHAGAVAGEERAAAGGYLRAAAAAAKAPARRHRGDSPGVPRERRRSLPRPRARVPEPDEAVSRRVGGGGGA